LSVIISVTEALLMTTQMEQAFYSTFKTQSRQSFYNCLSLVVNPVAATTLLVTSSL